MSKMKIVKFSIQLLIRIVLLLWLLWWWFVANTPFNEYEDLILDCDTDGELVAALGMWIIWLTTALILGTSICLKFWHRAKALWGINIVAVLISVDSIMRYRELIKYSEQLQQYCR